MHNVSVLIAKDLDFEMTGRRQKFFEQHTLVSECSFGFALRGFEGGHETFGLMHGTHAASTTTGHRFDEQRVTHFMPGSLQRVGALIAPLVSRYDVDTGGLHQHLGAVFLRHVTNRFGARAHKDEAGVDTRLCEVGIFGQEAITGMNCVGTALARGTQHRIKVEVTLGCGRATDANSHVGAFHMTGICVGIGIDRDARDA